MRQVRGTSWACAAGALALVAWATHAQAQALAQEDVPAVNQAALIFRILAYDRRSALAPGKELAIAVLYRQGEAAEPAEADVRAALSELAKKAKVLGRDVRVELVPWTDGVKVDKQLLAAGAGAIYLCRGLDGALPQIVPLLQQRALLSFAGSESYLNAGVAIGLVRRDNRAVILVNLQAAKTVGAELDPALFRTAVVMKR